MIPSYRNNSVIVSSCRLLFYVFDVWEYTHLVVSYIINIIKQYLYFSTYRSLINFVSEEQQGTQNASTPLIIQILLRDMLDYNPSFTLIKYHKYTHIIAREMAMGMKTFPFYIYLLLCKRTDIKSVIFIVLCGVHQCSEVRTIYLAILSSTQEKVLEENTAFQLLWWGCTTALLVKGLYEECSRIHITCFMKV